jgi:hypothetical protein
LYMATNIMEEHASFIQSWRLGLKPDTHWPRLCIWEQGSSKNTYCNLFLHSWCAYALHVHYPHIIITFTGLHTYIL